MDGTSSQQVLARRCLTEIMHCTPPAQPYLVVATTELAIAAISHHSHSFRLPLSSHAEGAAALAPA